MRPSKCANKEWLFDQYVIKGKSIDYISRTSVIPRKSVYYWLRRHGIRFTFERTQKTNPKPKSQDITDEELAIFLRTEFELTDVEIAKILDCTRRNVSYMMAKHGLSESHRKCDHIHGFCSFKHKQKKLERLQNEKQAPSSSDSIQDQE